jgi:hypothetical protein
MGFVQDPGGLYVPQASLVTRGPYPTIIGTITYRCHTCGDLIPKRYEVLFVIDHEWCSQLEPPTVTARTTTHHLWHMAE